MITRKNTPGVASGAQACFLTVKSTATPPRMHCGTHWRAFWPEKARLCPHTPDFVNAYPKIHQQTMERYVDAVS